MRLLLIISSFLLTISLASSQELSGKVLDENEEEIIDAYILNLQTKEHIHTDYNGEFTLNNYSKGDSLRVEAYGYITSVVVFEELDKPVLVQLQSKIYTLSEVVLKADDKGFEMMSKVDLQTSPVQSSQEILQKVPGLFIGQHAGGGKAEQLFLRGFDIDHGTDVRVSVDGMPVNMVSHAHGQGYADLHFVIPETVEGITYGKGPYDADKGNFATAGYVDFGLKEKVRQSTIKLERGQFNTSRALAILNLKSSGDRNGYIASEMIKTDGPFESSQQFNRINIVGKYTLLNKGNSKVSFTGSHFTSRWDASGQIPVRAVESGLINRYGAIDDTEGGKTSRSNAMIQYDKYLTDNSVIKTKVYYSNYQFDLYSNFTFFLNDSINGDQIRQYEQRQLMGLNSEYTKKYKIKTSDVELKVGFEVRNDVSNDNQLSRTKNRQAILERIQFGDVNETNAGAYASLDIKIKKFLINPGVRVDQFYFNYNDNLDTNYKTQGTQKATVSPKLNILYNYSDKLKFYAKTGIGFHSNDSRVVLENRSQKILPKAYGADLGVNTKLSKRLLLNTALWTLFSEQEFVYVGDEGVVELGGRTLRQGVDMSVRLEASDWLFFNVDANYAHSEAIDEKSGENHIPLAPKFTSVAGMSLKFQNGFYAGLKTRFMGDRPANEDNSIVAKGYAVTDANIGFKKNNSTIELIGLNVFNTQWNETQFATESRLKNESDSVEEIHFTPGTPFFMKFVATYNF